MGAYGERNYDFNLFGGGLSKSRLDKLSKNDSITYEFANKEELYKKLRYSIEHIKEINSCRKHCLGSAKKFSIEQAKETIWKLLNKSQEDKYT